MKAKRTTLKQRLIRLLDRWSNKLRPAHVPTYEREHYPVIVAGVQKRYGEGLEIVEVSLVSKCPYCGADDWDTPKTKPDGTVCKHPTRLRVVK